MKVCFDAAQLTDEPLRRTDERLHCCIVQGTAEQERVREHRRRVADRFLDQRAGRGHRVSAGGQGAERHEVLRGHAVLAPLHGGGVGGHREGWN